jgi:hypothetical protein
MNEESPEHLFMYCEFIKRAWFSSPLGVRVPLQIGIDLWLLEWLTCKDPNGAQVYLIFEKKMNDPEHVSREAVEFICEFNFANTRRSQQAYPIEPVAAISVSCSDFIVQVDPDCYNDRTTC